MLNYNPLNQKELDQTIDAIFKECEELEEQDEQKKKDKIRLNAIKNVKPNEALDLAGRTFLWLLVSLGILALFYFA